MVESRTLEFKREVSSTFLKTVSAFANFGHGEIRFGVDDNGNNIGLVNPVQARLDIENRINDSIHPRPDYYFVEHRKARTLSLFVEEGSDKPYLYRGKAYRRRDTASVEVDSLELRRLTLKGMNRNFEQLPADSQKLSFTVLQDIMKEILGIQRVNRDILKTLNLYDDENGYNHAAALLADKNDFPGIDMVRFGENINVLKNRKTLRNISVLAQYQEAVSCYVQNYREEVIDGFSRHTRELVPESAYREAVANALVHRTWDVDADIHIGMYDDRIDILSIGGLPHGMNKEEYLRGGMSILRNPILANVFYRLHYIEAFGTGVTRIRNAYKDYEECPRFEVTENSVRVSLPVLFRRPPLTSDQQKIYDVLIDNRRLSSSEIAEETGMKKSKVLRLLNEMTADRSISKSGKARGTRYSR